MEVLSNIENIGTLISINPEKNGEPRKIISNILKSIKTENPILIGLIFVGKRLISQDNLTLLKGRRHRKYWGLKYKSKINIKFGWHKIKNLTQQEMENLINNWKFDFFETHGKYLIEKSGGVLTPNHLIYTKTQKVLI